MPCRPHWRPIYVAQNEERTKEEGAFPGPAQESPLAWDQLSPHMKTRGDGEIRLYYPAQQSPPARVPRLAEIIPARCAQAERALLPPLVLVFGPCRPQISTCFSPLCVSGSHPPRTLTRAPWRRSAPPPQPSPRRRPSGRLRAGSRPSSACASAPPRAPTPSLRHRGRRRRGCRRGERAGGSWRPRLPPRMRRSALGWRRSSRPTIASPPQSSPASSVPARSGP